MPMTAEKIAFLKNTLNKSPEYRDILPLFLELFRFVEGKENATGISFDLSKDRPAERIKNGFPLLSAEDMKLNREENLRFLSGVIEVLARNGREGAEDLARLEKAFAEGVVNPASLYSACLGRTRGVMEEGAAAAGVPAPLLEFVVEIPLRTALEVVSQGVNPGEAAEWKENYCPVCGSRPGMGELVGEEGKRFLSCSACFFKWPFKRIQCAYCGNENPEELSYFFAGEGGVRVDTCKKCSRYLKTRDSRIGNENVPMEAEDLTTIHLDLLASREGLERGK